MKIRLTLLVVLLAVAGACSTAAKDDGERPGKTWTTVTTIPPTTTTTTDNRAALQAALTSKCMEAMSITVTGLGKIQDGLPLVAVLGVDSAQSREFLATAEEFVDTAIETMELCVTNVPQTQDFLNSLYNVRTSLKAL